MVIRGKTENINLSTSLFKRVIEQESFYVDKTKVIEKFLTTQNDVQLVARQRRLGKSLNMDTIRCFLTDREDLRHLFKGLYIETSPVWEKVNTAPVIYFDFKTLDVESYQQSIFDKICDYINDYCTETQLPNAIKRYINSEDYSNKKGLFYLTQAVYTATGKCSYLLIDEYDKLLMDNYNTEYYDEIRAFETALLSAALKGNEYLEKALLTGVMRISHESMLSGLNNIVTFDVFNDETYTDCYGLTEDEVKALQKITDFNIDELRSWYNGIRISGKPIYNIYAVMYYLAYKKYDCYWGKSGTLDMIVDLMNDNRKLTLVKLLNGEQVAIEADNRISLKQLNNQAGGDEAFFSLLIQGGYLALHERQPSGLAKVSIPNRELMIVWKSFILSRFYTDVPQVRSLFDYANNPVVFAKDVEYFLCERLSYHDLAVYRGENPERTQERAYHIYILGLLSAYEDMRYKYPLSNRESGDGRYDVLVERADAYYIFELKACGKDEDLEAQAEKALAQIEAKRYGVELETSGKRLVKIGVAFHGKRCRVRCAEIRKGAVA